LRRRLRRRRGRRQRGGSPRREERERVDVVVAVADPDPEVDVRDVVFGDPGRPGLRDRVALLYMSAASHLERAQVRQRSPVAVGGEDRHGEPVRRHRAGERDLAGSRRPDDLRVAERDVDPAMLSAGVGVVAEGEAAKHCAFRGPVPGLRAGSSDQRPDDRQHDGQSQSSCPLGQHDSTVAAAAPRVQGKLQSCYREPR
jgi:hypothetical protein